ncbi:MAG: efflux RND transporter periplasmic adaptor subunit [Methylobacterium sp.]|uniref:efflux RND transporter periplasmic adaptor subunit n=1 Tax=Methylobacterium sp. TaxID=409 RepID=UPI0025EE8581|nr:efflux RND transporter periplasmic adaptor subunit [Methylobacterium sp.]MBX9931232.1 efflux RND transporter periplasmic adaptor subunit [Methylobacterium sp.]
MSRFFVIPATLGVGLALGAFVPEVPQTIRSWAASAGIMALAAGPAEAEKPAEKAGGHAGHAHAPAKKSSGHGGHAHGPGEKEEAPEGAVLMTPEQIANAKIEVAAVDKGILSRKLTVPGVVTPDADRVARVAARVIGTVAELHKRLGDTVTKGEVVAVLDSREVAEAKNEFIAAFVGKELQENLFERDHALRDKGISAEQVFLRARTTLIEARLKVDLARQKLSALGVPDKEVASLSAPPAPAPTTKVSSGHEDHLLGLDRAPKLGLQRYEIRAPIGGQVVERQVDLGAPVNGEGQIKEIYTIADLSQVWVELAVPTSDLGAIRQGLPVTLTASNGGPTTQGKIVFVSPMLNAETRSAKVIASVVNENMAWRPGSYATVKVAVEEMPVETRLPRGALQTIEGEQVVFVRTKTGFEKREVVLGKGDDEAVEVVFGLDPGDEVAVSNSFILKAELGKAEAEHVH